MAETATINSDENELTLRPLSVLTFYSILFLGIPAGVGGCVFGFLWGGHWGGMLFHSFGWLAGLLLGFFAGGILGWHLGLLLGLTLSKIETFYNPDPKTYFSSIILQHITAFIWGFSSLILGMILGMLVGISVGKFFFHFISADFFLFACWYLGLFSGGILGRGLGKKIGLICNHFLFGVSIKPISLKKDLYLEAQMMLFFSLFGGVLGGLLLEDRESGPITGAFYGMVLGVFFSSIKLNTNNRPDHSL